MKIENVAGISLAAGRPAEQQRQLAIGLRMLREIIVNQQRVSAAIAKVLADRATRIRCDELQRSGFRGGRGDHGRILHRAAAVETFDHLRDGRALLPDRDVDAVNVLAALVDDRVDCDRGLAGLAVADYQLALTAPDLEHRVDRLDSGLERLLYGLALDNAGGLDLDPARVARLDRAVVVDRLAERVDHASEHRLANRNFGDAPCALDLVAFLDRLRVAEERRA